MTKLSQNTFLSYLPIKANFSNCMNWDQIIYNTLYFFSVKGQTKSTNAQYVTFLLAARIMSWHQTIKERRGEHIKGFFFKSAAVNLPETQLLTKLE